MRLELLKEADMTKTIALLKTCFPEVSFSSSFSMEQIEKHQRILIAKEEEHVIGHIWIQKQFDFYRQVDYFYLMYICVDPKYRRHGVATAMLTEVETWMEKEQVDYILFTSNRERKEALSLYRKLNYVEKGSFVFQKNRCKKSVKYLKEKENTVTIEIGRGKHDLSINR